MTSPGDPRPPAESRADRLARLTQLRAEMGALEAELGVPPATHASDTPRAGAGPAGPRRTGRGDWWRSPVVVVCVVLLGLLAPLTVVATWAHDQVSDTDRYVETVAPLAEDPAIQEVVSDRVTEALLARLDIEAVTGEAMDALAAQNLRPNVVTTLRALGTPLANAIEGFVGDKIDEIVQSEQFADAWAQMNRAAHEQMVALLTGKTGDAVTVAGDSVVLDLGAVVEAVKARLAEAGFALAERVPEFTVDLTIFQSSDIEKAQTAFRLLSALARALPVAVLLLLAVAVLVARRRRRTLVIASLVVCASMLALGLALNGFRLVYLDAIPTDQISADAAGAMYDQVVSFIRISLRAVLVIFLAVAAAAWLTGPGPGPASLRAGTSRALDGVRHRSDRMGLDTGPVGSFLGRYRGPVRAALAAAVVLIYILADHPTGAWTLQVVLVAGIVLLVVELLARPPVEGRPTADEASVPADQL